MNLLVISQMFPCKRHPTSAIFFAKLIKELSQRMDKIIVITPRVYIPRFATKIKGRWKKWFIDPVTSIEGRVEIFRPHVLSFPSFRFAGANGIIMQYALSELAIELAAKNKLDIILGNNMLPEGIAAEMLARKLNLPVVNWCIGTDINDFAEHNYLNHYLTKKCIKRSNMILTASNKLESKVREYAQNNNNVMTFYRGIDLLNFKNENKSDNTETDIKSDQGSKFILFVGRLLKTKGIYELAEAFIAVNNIYPDIKLTNNESEIFLEWSLFKTKLIDKFKAKQEKINGDNYLL